MDRYPLVNELVSDGRVLVEELRAAGVRVTLAFWGQIAEDDQHYLYLCSPDVEERGSRLLYADVRRAWGKMLDRAAVRMLTPDLVKLLGPSDPLVTDLVRWNGSRHVDHDARYRQTHFGGVPVDDMFVYTLPLPAPA